jgi:hypothetical protein
MLSFIWKNMAAFQQWKASISADAQKEIYIHQEISREELVHKKEEITFSTDENIRLHKALLDVRVQEEEHRAKLQADIVKLTADISFQNQMIQDLNQRFDNVSPFVLPIGSVWLMLLQEYKETNRPLLLIAPFWDETQINSENDAGGQQLRVTVADALRDTVWCDDFTILDGYFKRPLRQTDMDLRIINDVLKELPVCIVYGTLDQHEIRAEIALWNILPGEVPGRRVYIRGKGRMPRDVVVQDNREFKEDLGTDLANEVGQIGAIYHFFESGRQINVKMFLTGESSRDQEVTKRFSEYLRIHQLLLTKEEKEEGDAADAKQWNKNNMSTHSSALRDSSLFRMITAMFSKREYGATTIWLPKKNRTWRETRNP